MMRHKTQVNRREMLRLLTLGAGGALLAACGAAAPVAPAAPKEAAKPTDAPVAETKPAAAPAAAANEIIVGISGDPQKIDPAFTYDFTTSQIVNQTHENLFRFVDGSKVDPWLAESVTDKDGIVWIYKIRKGVKFHDGSEMTADDVVFSLQRTKDPKTASYVGWMFSNVDKIEKTDDSTVTVTLSKPDAFWPYVLATTGGGIVSKKQFDAVGKDKFGTPDAGAFGTGPFKFISWKSGDEVVIEKFAEYWAKDKGGPYLDKAIIKILPEATTRVAGLKSGELHLLLGTTPPDQLNVVKGFGNIKITGSESYYNDFLAFNTQREPFNNPKLRQAINYAVDKAAVWANLVGEWGTVGKAMPVPPRLWTFEKETWAAAYEKLPAYKHDLDLAKKLAAESGVADKANGKVIITDEDPVHLGIALAVQAGAKEIGIDLKVEKIPNAELTSRGFGGARDYDLIVTPWGSDFPDPAGNLQPVFNSAFVGDGGSNFGNYKNPEVDKLLNEQANMIDPVKRTALLTAAQQLIADDSVWIVFGHQKQVLALNDAYEGYSPNPLWYWDAFLKDVKKK